MNGKILKIFLILASMLTYTYVQAQVSGTITDAETGEILIGANILIKGSSTGTVTDFDGRYSIDAQPGDILIFSYTGYTSQEIAVDGNVIDIQLASGSELEEIVIVGYGSVKKSDLTGAVTALKSDDFNTGMVTSSDELMQGRAAGVQITTSSGEPGAATNIRIRGTSSVSSSNRPLYVIDGFPLSGNDASSGTSKTELGEAGSRNPLNFFNPADIESIDILKDASATAIYGSRGANGVVIIKTKTGAGSGYGGFEYGYSLGISQASSTYDLLDREGYLSAAATYNTQFSDGGADTDWQNELLRTAYSQNHYLAYGNSDEKGNYRFSFGYLDQQGVVKESGLERYTVRFNGNRKIWEERLIFSSQIALASILDDNVPITDNSGANGDLLAAAYILNPTLPIKKEDDTYNQLGTDQINPVALLNLSNDYTNTLKVIGNFSADLKITDDLNFKIVGGIDRSISTRKQAYSKDLFILGLQDQGALFTGEIEENNKLFESYFTYNKDFTSKITFNGLLGYSFQEYNYITKQHLSKGFRTSDPDLMINNAAAWDNVDGNVVNVNSSNETDQLQSFFGRANLSFDGKYLFTATLRADGSTRFAKANRYGYFPSIAFKWRLLEEGFLPNAFSDLSLRLGYGLTGNQSIPHNIYQVRQRYEDYEINAAGDVSEGELVNISFSNPDLKWESTLQYNLGIDYGFQNNRIFGSIDYYYKQTNDLLIKVIAAQPAASEFVWRNIDGDIINSGVEFAINYIIIDQPDFEWDINANVAYNDNLVKNYNGILNTGEISGQGLTGAFAQRIANDQPLYSYFLRVFDGFDNEGQSIYPNGDVQEFVGKRPLPKYLAGLSNTWRYKNLSLKLGFTGQFGHYIYNNTANALFTAGSLAGGRNSTTDVVTNGESKTNAPDVSTRFLEKGDFVRLQNLTLSYLWQPKTDYIERINLYATGQNLFVITKYTGLDPEVDTNKALEGIPSAGIDYTSYPRATTYSIGVNISF
ncbi:SusC/RagA family TonB-linked outer membrane protein [Membranihabitans marinus]|uniref:SusC/RagA family TonB-linked outer membrane protein n=1 Tax=Membranihabitans marinus TaxID=1227546 RepID=UPI001F00E760|nr:SusC/RagA family TonB-linked outer membrane protein [Membranihabitans marinus]